MRLPRSFAGLLCLRLRIFGQLSVTSMEHHTGCSSTAAVDAST